MKNNDNLTARLEALENENFDSDERELLRFVIRAIKSAQATLWLTNGVIKYLLPPLGVIWGLYHYGVDTVAWLRGFGK